MKMHFVLDGTPANSMARNRPFAIIPPFSHPGPLPATDTGLWSPPKPVQLLSVSARSTTTGTANARLYIVRMEPSGQQTVLGLFFLLRDRTVAGFHFPIQNNDKPIPMATSLKRAIITPYEPVLIRSEIASGHNDLVVQLVGEYI
jgi:hypothetical protein